MSKSAELFSWRLSNHLAMESHTVTLIKTTALAGFFAVATLAAATNANAAPIVTNGDFTSGMKGWTVAGHGVTPGLGITSIALGGANSTGYSDNVSPYTDGSGHVSTNAAYFVDDQASESISQVITLAGNTQYTLSYALFATVSGANNPNSFLIFDTITGLLSSFTNTQAITPGSRWRMDRGIGHVHHRRGHVLHTQIRLRIRRYAREGCASYGRCHS